MFGALFAGLADPGGAHAQRTSRTAGFALIGAAVTALGFGIAANSWGWLVLSAFAVTLVTGLAVTLGVRRFVAGLLLNLWFIITVDLGDNFHRHAHITSHVWVQVVSWAGGSALWIAVAFIAWLVTGRKDAAQPVPELPGGTSPRKPTLSLIVMALIRALAIAGTVAIAFGLDLSHAIDRNPMDRVRQPKTPTKLVPVMREDDTAKALDACKGKGFANLRDEALIRLYANTGARLSEVGNLLVNDLDLNTGSVHFHGKCAKDRRVRFGPKTARALSKYLRTRDKHKGAGLPNLWLADRGAAPLTPNGVKIRLKRLGHSDDRRVPTA